MPYNSFIFFCFEKIKNDAFISKNYHKSKMISTIPPDLVFNILKNVPYKQFKYMNSQMKLNLTDKEMFIITKNNNSLFQKTLQFYSMSNNDFMNYVSNSCFEIDNISDNIDKIGMNLITIHNKKKFKIDMNNITDNPLLIESSIRVSQVLLKMIEVYIQGEFIINNPYYNVFTVVCNNLMHCFITIISNCNECKTKQSYEVIDQKMTKYRLMIYQNMWYKTNLNIFSLLILYMDRLNVVSLSDDEQILLFMKGEIDTKAIECLEEFNKIIIHDTITKLLSYPNIS